MHSSSLSDPDLLAQWLDHRREEAFRELVGRYAGLVHGSARRTCGDDAMAAEVAQLTFIALARKAKSLTGCPSLAGWLHRTAILQARNQHRQATRESRKRHALQAAMEPPSPSPDDAWLDLQPALDDALAALSAKDREALLLRFYRSLSVKEIAATLGIATDAAQKRIDRATDRLRGKLVSRGCQAGGSLSAVMLAGFASDAQAAAFAVPLFTAKAVAAGAVGSGAFTATTAFLTASAMKTTAVAVSLVIVLAAGAWLATEHWPAPASVSDPERQPESASGQPKTPPTNDPYGDFRRKLEAEAKKREISMTELIKEKITLQLERYPPTSELWVGCPLLLVLQEAFCDDPGPYLEALTATLQGQVLQQAVHDYASLAQKRKSPEMFATAYRIIPPGERNHIIVQWAALLGRTEGFDKGFGLIETLEFPEESYCVARGLRMLHQNKIAVFTPEQIGKLEALLKPR